MGKRLCLTFSVYYFVHPYNITALMICQHVFLIIYIFLQKALYFHYCISNISCIFVGYYKGFSTIHNDTASSWNGRLTIHFIYSVSSNVHFLIFFVHYIVHFISITCIIRRIKSSTSLLTWSYQSQNINDNPERSRYNRLSPSLCFDKHAPDPFQT